MQYQELMRALALIFLLFLSPLQGHAAFSCDAFFPKFLSQYLPEAKRLAAAQAHFAKLRDETHGLVNTNLGFEAYIHEEAPSATSFTTKVIITNKEQKLLAYGTFFTIDNGTNLQIGYMWTEPTYYKNDLSRLVLARMLELNPKTKKITTNLSESNGAIFRREKENQTEEEAMKLTPAYKIRAALGFSKISSDSKPHEQYLIVEQEDPN